MQKTYQVIALPRRGGKLAYVIQRALKNGTTIATTSEATKRNILQTAHIMGVRPPEVIVLPTKPERLRGVTFAGVIVDYQI